MKNLAIYQILENQNFLNHDVSMSQLVLESEIITVKSETFIEPLSSREQGILDLIDLGLSNQNISERLSISISTVKGHIQNIFGKLQVQRRTEAVARARALKLIL